ncbi:FapA family protein [Geomonas sp. RF6]|uniref:DUF342 domain-containing protein n=1 Tax=Geomonas sp. RF6 TaxID=2897342 RepID=UPI001E2F36DC|nr:FapA family protein [Geomonas sp. RF6]UFS70767.1 FapA family protein [Geomonas sp. RF6]
MADIVPPTVQQAKRLELKRLGYAFELLLAPDATSCIVTYTPTGNGPPLAEAELRQYLEQARVKAGVFPDSVEELLNHAAQGKALAGLLLAEGTPMVPGEDARLELNWTPPPPAESDDDDAVSVDLHRVQEFFNVKEGDLVATLLPSTPGTPGLSIHGAEIPARAGSSLQVKPGKNVALTPDGTQIFATAAGRVFCQGEDISVEDIYQVKGDVGFKVGNVDFNGFLEVTGDILDGFQVRASKGIKVGGNVGACTLTSDGDITFCGMNGQGKGVISCGGTLKANFIYETKLEVAGDLVVESEMRLCGIKCLGSVHVNRGGVVGGECVALAGVEAGALGSVSSLHTRVVVGVSYRDLEELTQRFDELKELTAREKLAHGSKGETNKLHQQRVAITSLIQEIRSRVYTRANAKVNVRKMMYGGVTVSLGTMTEEFREERPGPFSMIENTVEGGVRFLGMTDLAFAASSLEREFVRQAQLLRH